MSRPLRPALVPRTGRRVRALAVLAGLGLVLAACSGSGANDTAPDGAAEAWVTAYEDFDGQSTTLEATAAGKPVVLNFFASWCAPCIAEMPEFEKVHQQYADEVTFIGLATRDTGGPAADLIERTGVTYAVGLDPTGEMALAYQNLQAMPTTMFLAADGTVVDGWAGQLTEDALIEKIDENLL